VRLRPRAILLEERGGGGRGERDDVTTWCDVVICEAIPQLNPDHSMQQALLQRRRRMVCGRMSSWARSIQPHSSIRCIPVVVVPGFPAFAREGQGQHTNPPHAIRDIHENLLPLKDAECIGANQ